LTRGHPERGGAVKFLAILKDSFREAVDVRVGYLLVSLSCALILVFASLSAKPRPARSILTRLEQQLNNSSGERAADRPAGSLDPNLVFFRIPRVEPLDGAPDRPESPLRFTVLAQFTEPGDAARIKESPEEAEELIRRRFGRIGHTQVLVVTEVQPAQPGDPLVPPADNRRDVYFQVLTQPTAGTLRIWPHDTSLLFGAIPLSGLWQLIAPVPLSQDEATPPLGVQVYVIQQMLVNAVGSWVAVLVSVFVTSFFIPNMLQKGTIDMLLVKPIQRWRLLVYKYFGGLTFIFLNASLAVVGVWFVLGLRSGIWCHHLLLLVPVLTFFFAVLYAVSTLVGVLTRSPITAILVTCLVWAVLYGIGRAHLYFHDEEPALSRLAAPASSSPQRTAVAVIDACHFVLPRTKDLDVLTSDLLEKDLIPELGQDQAREGPPLNWGESLAVSGAFIAVLLGLACVYFTFKDY
jgi:hypothetical protein